ncbi:MAG: hypothetical protein HFE63_09760 [Clostridiales bacterium]|nr:hypothetical protein [Clostridiales bacterium]
MRLKRSSLYLTAVIGITVVFLLIFSVFVSAADTDWVLYDFSTNSGEWSHGDNTKEAVVGRYQFGDDEAPFYRDCLEVISHDLTVQLIRTVVVDFDDSIDLTEYRKFSCEMYAIPFEDDPSAVYYARLTLFSADGTSVETLTLIPSGEWTKVSLDISTWGGRDDIVSAEMGIKIITNSNKSHANSFFIDDVTAGEKVNRELTERFLFDVFDISGGQANFASDGCMLNIRLSPSVITSLEATVFIPDVEWKLNCLRLELANKSDLDSFTLHYSTYDTEALSEDKSLSIKLDKTDDSKYYYIDVGDVSMLHNIRMQFDGGSGNIEIASICALSVYNPEQYETCGSVDSCILRDDLSSIHFTGEINRDEVLANQDGTICIYALNSGNADEIASLNECEPLLTSPMTTKFDLSLTLNEASQELRYAIFAVVSRHVDGTMILAAPPFCIQNPERAASVSISSEFGPKGVAAADISYVGESLADVSLITIYADDIFAMPGSGERYIYNGNAYYFNQSTFNALDGKISALGGAGVKVLLRIADWNRALEAELYEGVVGQTYLEYSYNNIHDGTDFLMAFGSYIAERWCVDASISGIVWGNILNNIEREEENTFLSLNDMVEYDAQNLRKMYNALMSVNSETRLYASFSEMYTVELTTESIEVGLEIYLTALNEEISRHGRFDYGIVIDKFYRIGEVNGSAIDIANCEKLIDLMRGYGIAEPHLLFCDSTYTFSKLTIGELVGELVKGYYCACFNDNIDAYIVSLDTLTTGYIAEYLAALDTKNRADVASLALSTLKLSDWSDIIDNYDEKRLPLKRVTSYEAFEDEPSGIKGSYKYYNFDSFSNVSDFKKGYYCVELSVKGSGTPALTAKLDRSAYDTSNASKYMGIAHRFEYPENLKLTPVLEVTLAVSDVNPTNISEIPVKLVLFAGNERFEANALLAPNESKTIYVDVSDFSLASDVEGIQLLVDGSEIQSATLQLYSINGLSREYNDESLESVIADERAKKRSPNPTETYGIYIWFGAGILVAVATILVVVLLSRKKRERI